MCYCIFVFFFFNDTATTEIYTLSLHDALPISRATPSQSSGRKLRCGAGRASSCRRRTLMRRLALAVLSVMLTADRKSTRLNSSHLVISYAVFCLKKKKHSLLMTSAGYHMLSLI